MSLPNSPSYKTSAIVHVGRLVKLTGDNTVAECTATTDVCVGIARRAMRDTPGVGSPDNTIAANSGESIEIFGPGAVAPALAGAAITAGAILTSNASGQPVAMAAATNGWIVGIALEAASGAGVEIQVLVNPAKVGQA